MFDGDGRKKLRLVTALTLWAATLIGLGSSPARASYFEHGVWLSADIVRDDVTYAVSVKALQAMGGNRVELSISRSAEGAGSVMSQTQTWNFPLGPGEFTQDGGTYRVDAGSDSAPFRVDLVVERRQEASCSDDQELFVTEGDGFRIETGNDTFGTITELPDCATTWSYSSGPLPGPPPCPLRGQELMSRSLNAKERRGSDVARVQIFLARERSVPGGSAQWELDVSGTVPATSFRLTRELDGSVAAAGAPWLEGKARFEPTRPAARGEWYDCRGGREARSLAATGAITGDLTVDIIGYDDHTFDEAEAWALRSRVRPRR